MEWIVAAGLIIIFAAALPPIIIGAKKSVRSNSRLLGVVLSIGFAFSFLHDPRKQEVIENIGKRENEGEEDCQSDFREDEG